MSQSEIWGGIECTVNRVGDQYFDQLEKNGHAHRIEDLKLFADLGIKTIRYPLVWERIAPNGVEKANWSWADERLHLLKELGITPIIGLLHHGSGPSYTSLVDPEFPGKLTEYAMAVAERYPWLEWFTPINEPLTTARFSGLYGFWYPHGKNDNTFARCFLLQCKGIIEAMRGIKSIIPTAKLVQTEDLGKTYSTPKLAYQADFENTRRWLTFDLLSGKFNSSHPLWNYFRNSGILDEELEYFSSNFHTPEIIGINHYITSERFLDQRLSKYPEYTHGNNGKDSYADVEAVRACAKGVCGLPVLLSEVFDRYKGVEVAITEVHLGCTREEQVRWVHEVYELGQKMKKAGKPLKAVTAWSVLGAYNWNTLLTRDMNHYESGLFDLRGNKPRPTLLAKMIKSINSGQEFNHPVLETPGWWKRSERLIYNKELLRFPKYKKVEVPNEEANKTPVFIIGARGTLGQAFARTCQLRGIPYKLMSRGDMDIADMNSIVKQITEKKPWAIINAAGYVKVDEAEFEKEKCFRENTIGPANLAKACNNFGIKLMTFSTDLVFNGRNKVPYMETDITQPLNVYGLSKLQAEKEVLLSDPNSLIIRTSSFFGPWDEYNFATKAINCITKGNTFLAAKDQIISPTYVPDLVNASLDLLVDDESGIWHISNPSSISWVEFAKITAQMAGLNDSLIEGCDCTKLGYTAGRPIYSVLSSERGVLLPNLEDAIQRYLKEVPIFQMA